MISRRRFLEVGGVAGIGVAGVAVASNPLVAAAAQKSGEAELPASLLRLQSRKTEATPIMKEERQERLERARAVMNENGLGAIVLMAGTSLNYFTGIRWWGGERMFALILPAKGAAF
jgi:Xaa-Pro dipeptidase